MNATAVLSPALAASVAMWRPGCTAARTGDRCGCSRARSASRSDAITTSPQKRAGPGGWSDGLHELEDRRSQTTEPLPERPRVAHPAQRHAGAL